MRAMLRYSFIVYLTNCHYLLPLLFIMIHSGFLFAVLPFLGMGGFSISMTVLFMISLLDGFFAYKLCSKDMRAIIVLKSGSAVKYYASNEVLFVILASGYTILVLLCPCLQYICRAEHWDGWAAAELAAIVLVHLLVALCGYQIGSLFQPHMIGRKLPVAVMILLTVLGIFLRHQMSMVPVIKYLFWVFPPIVEVLYLLRTMDKFFCPEIGYAVLQLALYTLILLVCKGIMLRSRQWEIYE